MDHLEHYWKLAESEQGFNSSQAGIRGLASAWLLAAVGAIGLLVQADPDTSWLIPRNTLVIIVCTLAAAGISTLWILDQLVFHRLLDSVFLTGIKMEFDDPRLPPIRSMMMMSAEGKGMHRWQRLFYLLPLLIFLLVSLLAVSIPLTSVEVDGSAGLRWVVVANWVLIAGQVMLFAWVLTRQQTIGFADRADLFGNEEFARLVRSESYQKIIERHRRP